MKDRSLQRVVILADQRRSRTDTDRVPQALSALEPVAGLDLGFERTAGDEIQGLTRSASAVVAAVTALTRLGGWRLGIGIGTVETPLPSSTRAARGPAYLAARAAIGSAHRAAGSLVLTRQGGPGSESEDDVGADSYAEQHRHLAEGALLLLRSVLARRTAEGWELIDMLDAGTSPGQAATRLGISASAVSQRLARSQRTEAQRGAELAEHHLGLALGGSR